MITVKFWGTRGSIASPGKETLRYGGNTSCVEVRAGKQVVIFDSGTGIRALGNSLLKEFSARPLTVHIFISHSHWDHIQGFPFFLPAYQKQNTVHVYGPTGRDKSLDAILKTQMDADYFPVGLGDMNATIQAHEISDTVVLGDITVQPFYLNHPAMTLAYRLSDGKRSVVYATDNEPYRSTLHSTLQHVSKNSDYPEYLDEKFVQFLSGTDLYIGEAQYTRKEYESKIGWGHSSVEATVEFAWRARVKRLSIFHHDPMHSDAAVDKMVKHAKELIRFRKGKIDCFGAKEGMQIKLR